MDRINSLEKEITEIRKKLHEKETELYTLKKQWINANSSNGHDNTKSYEHIVNNSAVQPERLPRWAIERYSRQILLPQLGVRGQAKLCSGRVLVVGAGGLGCPAAAYLAGAGVGTIGVVDYDTVEITNVHRQILHGEGDERLNKVDSAADTLRRMNSSITIKPYNVQLDSRNALDIVTEYDVVLDCTDNVPTRYLLNDVCVLTKRPLISGSALKMEGQLTIYGYREKEDCAKAPQQPPTPPSGPCYRCVFPAPPPAAAVGSCSADGVAGPVPGTIGVLQALEALKYLAGLPRDKLLVGRMVLFDGEDMTFRNVKLRAANPECAACSSNATITKLIDYEQFCKARAKEKDLDLDILPDEARISATELADLRLETNPEQRHLLVDVRSEPEFNMCSIDGTVNYAIEKLRGGKLEELVARIKDFDGRAIFICRRGNDSQLAAERVQAALGPSARVKDLRGGLHAWASLVDKEFPVY